MFIREHVWIGRRANILYGADIGSGSIVGLGAFVNKTFPGNAVIAGNPARIVNENVAWNDRPDEFLDDYEDFRRYDYRDLQE